MDWKLEVIVLPVADIDRAKAFYTDKLDFKLDVDHRAGESFRVVQLTPRGSACSISMVAGGMNPAASTPPGSVKGLHLIVSDIEAAHAELAGRGAETGEIFHFEAGRSAPGPDPERNDYGSFFSFDDPDGNGWLVQEVRPLRSADAPA
jgi:catechol 2,3-dioxygenase-like lactoylglutathione lyase family enzyme